MNNAEQLLQKNGFFASPVHGVSMLPLLTEHRDIAFIEPREAIQRYDVVLFRRASGQLVLHRVLKRDTAHHGYLIAGDNDRTPERVKHEQILGVMTAFSRNGKTVRADSPLHRWYARVWHATPFTRTILQCGCRLIRRLRKGGRV